MNHRRPCLPGKDCTEYLKRKEGEQILRKPNWDTDTGRQMWLAGKTDDEIARTLGTTARAVNLYKYRNWVPERNVKEIEGIPGPLPEVPPKPPAAKKPSAPRRGKSKAESLAEIAAVEEIISQKNSTGEGSGSADIKKDESGPETAPQSETTIGNDCEDTTAENWFEEMSAKEPAKESVVGELLKVNITSMDVMAMATEHLQGMEAVCTANAIQALLFWHCPEDLLQARDNIDYLLKRVEKGRRHGR